MADSYIGLAAEVLSIIADIATPDAELKSQCDSNMNFETRTQALSLGQTLLLASALQKRLTQWVCSPSNDDSQVLLEESYRNSALIYLFQYI